jgi:hypothetical protein
MPELWLPGAYQDPGVNAYYNAGRSSMQLVVAHFTVGRDSRAEGLRGYFNWLVHRDASRENGCTQYAPTDAVTWHAFGSSAMTDAPTRGPGVKRAAVGMDGSTTRTSTRIAKTACGQQSGRLSPTSIKHQWIFRRRKTCT